jgi:hypothetical protein
MYVQLILSWTPTDHLCDPSEIDVQPSPFTLFRSLSRRGSSIILQYYALAQNICLHTSLLSRTIKSLPLHTLLLTWSPPAPPLTRCVISLAPSPLLSHPPFFIQKRIHTAHSTAVYQRLHHPMDALRSTYSQELTPHKSAILSSIPLYPGFLRTTRRLRRRSAMIWITQCHLSPTLTSPPWKSSLVQAQESFV